FFFQAEDGIRDKLVTGVQTCALPIYYRTAEGARSTGRQTPTGRRTSEGERRERRSSYRGAGGWPMPQPCLFFWWSGASRAQRKEIGRASCREKVRSTEGEG